MGLFAFLRPTTEGGTLYVPPSPIPQFAKDFNIVRLGQGAEQHAVAVRIPDNRSKKDFFNEAMKVTEKEHGRGYQLIGKDLLSTLEKSTSWGACHPHGAIIRVIGNVPGTEKLSKSEQIQALSTISGELKVTLEPASLEDIVIGYCAYRLVFQDSLIGKAKELSCTARTGDCSVIVKSEPHVGGGYRSILSKSPVDDEEKHSSLFLAARILP